MLRHIFSLIRGIASIGVVQSVDDSGQAQRVTVATLGGTRAGIEVMQIFGLASNPPAQGSVCLLISTGADKGNLRALPLSGPAARFGNLLSGETVLYAADGTRVALRSGGVVEIWGGTSVTVNTKTCTINAPNGCTVNGDATVHGNALINGNVTYTGNLTGGE
jgi:phage gp45-like